MDKACFLQIVATITYTDASLPAFGDKFYNVKQVGFDSQTW